MAFVSKDRQPPSWQVIDSGRDARLRLGTDVIALEDIREMRSREHVHAMRGGLLASFISFMVATSVCIIGVVEIGWRTRFLLAAFVCAVLGGSAIVHAARQRSLRQHYLEVELTSGRIVTWSTADPAVMQALLAAIASVYARRKAATA